MKPGKGTTKWLIAALAVAAVYWFGLRSDPRVEVLNQAIRTQGSAALKNYPYQFRVVGLEGSIAVMNTPRSSEMPVYRMIRAIDPALSGKAAENPDFVAAEKALAKVQIEARQIVLGQPGVSDVKWELDRNWLVSHQITPE